MATTRSRSRSSSRVSVVSFSKASRALMASSLAVTLASLQDGLGLAAGLVEELLGIGIADLRLLGRHTVGDGNTHAGANDRHGSDDPGQQAAGFLG